MSKVSENWELWNSEEIIRDDDSNEEEEDNESRMLRKKGGEPSPKTASKNIGIKELMTRVQPSMSPNE
jgi:hypothetical protein